MNFNLKARLIAAIGQFKASNDIRYFLNGVYVEPHPVLGAIVVATNGHAMGIWRDDSATGIDRPVILKIDSKLLKACEGSDLKRLTVRDGRLAVVIADRDQEVYIQPIEEKRVGCPPWEIEGKYPDWRQVVPNKCPAGLQGLVNIKLLAVVDRALHIGSSEYSNLGGIPLQCTQENPTKAALVKAAGVPDFAAVIMPMRGDAVPYPTWLENEVARSHIEKSDTAGTKEQLDGEK